MRTDSISKAGRSTTAAHHAPMLWAVGGGKGGVGKSLVCSSLAIAYSRLGHRCALIDLDLGAANAHSLLGMRAPSPNLTQFIDRRVESLQDILVPTPFENLLLAGAGHASLDLANPKYSQKERLLRQIRTLDVDHVFMDLSAGCAFNVLDFFLAAHKRIAVLVPESTAIENTQHFLKTAFFRSLRDVAKQEPLASTIRKALSTGRAEIRSARDLIATVEAYHCEAGAILAAQAARFSPMLVVNQVSAHAARGSASQIALACRHFLASNVRERGRLPRDERVRDAAIKGAHVLDAFPGSPFSMALERLVSDLVLDQPGVRLATVPSRACLAAQGTHFPPLGDSDPGSYLRICREKLGLSLKAVSQATRIQSISRIENGRYDELPGENYVAAFVRQYAKMLGIGESERLTARYIERYRSAVLR